MGLTKQHEIYNLASGLDSQLPAEMKPPVEIYVISNVLVNEVQYCHSRDVGILIFWTSLKIIETLGIKDFMVQVIQREVDSLSQPVKKFPACVESKPSLLSH